MEMNVVINRFGLLCQFENTLLVGISAVSLLVFLRLFQLQIIVIVSHLTC